MYCQEYTTIRRELHSHILYADARYTSLSDNEGTMCVLWADNKDTSKIIGQYSIPFNVSKKKNRFFVRKCNKSLWVFQLIVYGHGKHGFVFLSVITRPTPHFGE